MGSLIRHSLIGGSDCILYNVYCIVLCGTKLRRDNRSYIKNHLLKTIFLFQKLTKEDKDVPAIQFPGIKRCNTSIDG